MVGNRKTGAVTFNKRVNTRQCSRFRRCRARLTVESEGGQLVIKAGYNIRALGGRRIDKRTKRRIRNTRTRRARVWARRLLAKVADDLGAVKCSITEEEVVIGIMSSLDGVLSCADAGTARCETLIKVGECASTTGPVIPPNECLDFLRSNPTLPALSNLQAKCPGAAFIDEKRIEASIPLCLTSCSSDPDAPKDHWVEIDYGVQSATGEEKETCLLNMYAAALNFFYPSVLECSALPSSTFISSGRYFILYFDSRDNSPLPADLQAIEDSATCNTSIIFFRWLGETVNDLVSASCASATS